MTVSPQDQPRVSNSGVIDLRELIHILWKSKWLIAAITTGVAVISVVVSLLLPNIYQARAVLAPNDQQGPSGLSALAAQYGGLASLAGISIANGGTDKTAFGLEVLTSRKFLGDFVNRRNILVPLMAAEGWDPVSGDLKINPSTYDVATKTWVRKVAPRRSAIPSSQEAYKKLKGILSVRQNKKTGFVTVSVEHFSPVIAKQWVDWLVEDLNSFVMQQDVAEAEQAIEYLNQQIESTSVADLQNVFFNLIEEQTKTVMLAKVTDEYLLKTLDPAVVPELKSKPKRSLIVIFFTILGFFLAVAVVLAMTSLRRPRS